MTSWVNKTWNLPHYPTRNVYKLVNICPDAMEQRYAIVIYLPSFDLSFFSDILYGVHLPQLTGTLK